MKVLIIGNGAREHALAWKLAQSPLTPQLWMAPGNPGMASLGICIPISADDIAGLLEFAQKTQIDFTIVGPELPLSLGVVDRFQAAGLAIFGPSQAAARLESSKAFAKAVMQQAGIPTGGYVHARQHADALASLLDFTPPYVIKEDGLAAGKGVTVAPDKATATLAIEAAFNKGMTVVIEEFLEGEELSILALCDGEAALPLVSAQDFKRAYDGDQGPNTGGMGAYAPVPWVDANLMTKIQTRVLNPALRVMANAGTPYRGVLYAGLMIHPNGDPYVVEFNARFGDPETQVVLPLIDEDLLPLLQASANGSLAAWKHAGIAIKSGAAINIVLAAKGYPGAFAKGSALILPKILPEDTCIFHAGTALGADGCLQSNGGRVLSAMAMASTLAAARDQAYQLAAGIDFDEGFYRKDIALEATLFPPADAFAAKAT